MDAQWIEMLITATPDRLYDFTDYLTVSGYESLEILDGDEWTVRAAGLPPELMDDDVRLGFKDLCAVRLYFPDTAAGREDAAMCRALVTAYDPALTVETLVKGEDGWLDNWKRYYQPTPVGKRLLIQPEWLPLVNPESRVVYLNDPGVCFGTGTHATTRLCLALLEESVLGGETLLDIGCGSGILAVCGLLLGAERAAAVDIDPLAVGITRKNAARNGIGEDRLDLHCLNICDEPLPCSFDVITANLTADVIRAVLPTLPGLLNPGGRVILSGILEDRAEATAADAAAYGFAANAIRREDGWAAILATKEATA